MTDNEARRMMLALLAARVHGATVCPSEVARALVADCGTGETAGDWRSAMPIVHAAVDRLLAEGQVDLSWKGSRLEARAGPYRVGRRQPI